MSDDTDSMELTDEQLDAIADAVTDRLFDRVGGEATVAQDGEGEGESLTEMVSQLTEMYKDRFESVEGRLDDLEEINVPANPDHVGRGYQ